MSKLTQQDLLRYEAIQTDLKKLKKEELALRNKIIKSFRYGDQLEGVCHKSVEGLDIDIAITLKLTRSIDSDGLDMIWSDLDDEQRAVISYSPKLDLKAYKALVENDAAGELINVVTEKPAQGTVALKFD